MHGQELIFLEHGRPGDKDFCHVYLDFLGENTPHTFKLFRGHSSEPRYSDPGHLYAKLVLKAVDHLRRETRVLPENEQMLEGLIHRHLVVEMYYQTYPKCERREAYIGPDDIFGDQPTHRRLVRYLERFSTDEGSQRLIFCRLETPEAQHAAEAFFLTKDEVAQIVGA